MDIGEIVGSTRVLTTIARFCLSHREFNSAATSVNSEVVPLLPVEIDIFDLAASLYFVVFRCPDPKSHLSSPVLSRPKPLLTISKIHVSSPVLSRPKPLLMISPLANYTPFFSSFPRTLPQESFV